MRPTNPIGVFDSGLGGLTVAAELKKRLPQENIVYLGDVARLPYGTKSKSVVESYSRQCIDFLLSQGVKTIVVACNTASSLALPSLHAPNGVPLFGVVRSGVQAALRIGVQRRVLVLATAATVASEAYCREMAAFDPAVRVEQIACPLWVPLAEQGWLDHPITVQIVEHYLKHVNWTGLDAVILGCTHFPLLLPSLRRVVPDHVPLVHGAGVLAEQVEQCLGQLGLLVPRSATNGSVRVFLTDRVQPLPGLDDDWLPALMNAESVSLNGALE